MKITSGLSYLRSFFLKSLAMYRVSILDALQYKTGGFIYNFMDIFPSFVMIYFWSKAFESQSLIAGQTKEVIITYYVIASFATALLISHPEWELANKINSGELSAFLLRPASVMFNWFIYELAFKINRFLFIIPGLIALYFILKSINSHPLALTVNILILISFVLSFILIFLIKFLIGLTAFWFTQINWLVGISEFFSLLLSGALMPLYFFPDWFQRLASFFPFQFYTFVPAQLLLGRYDSGQIITLLFTQLSWLFILFFFSSLVWKKGLRDYSSYGS